MKKTNRLVTIHNENSFIERRIYLDKENNEYVKIYDTYISISIIEEYYNYQVNVWF